MPSHSRPRPRRHGALHPIRPRHTGALHPVRSRPIPKVQRFRQPKQTKYPKVPAAFRGPAPRPLVEHVLEQCALPDCENPLAAQRGDARHCCPAHRLKHWRMIQREAAAKSRSKPVTPRRVTEGVKPDHTEAAAAAAVEVAREVAYMMELLNVDPNDEDARAWLRTRANGRSRP